MSLPKFQRTVVTDSGDVVAGADITVKSEATGLNAVLYTDRAGTLPLANPFTTGNDGLIEFFAEPGEYRVQAVGGAGSIDWRYITLSGTAAIEDVTTGPTDRTTGRVKRTDDENVLSRDSVADIASLTNLYEGQKIIITSYLAGWAARGNGLPKGGGTFEVSLAKAKSLHDGAMILSLTVPYTNTPNYLNGVGETDPSGSGCLLRLDENISPYFFGAVGDLSASDSITVQAAVDYCIANQTPLYPEDGKYSIDTAINLTGQIEILGTGGFDKSVFVGTGTAIFTYASLDLSRFDNISLRATSPNCKAFEQTNLLLYTYNCTWTQCDFFYSLSECIYGNLILCDITANSFGYHGPAAPAQTQHRHIYSKGDQAASTTNINHILRNKFYNANGVAESCYFESGFRLNCIGNTFETNQCSALTLAGMSDTTFEMNWVENNNAMFAINIKDNPEVTIGNYIVDINKNRFVSVYPGAYIADVTGSGEITSFSSNQISGTFFEVTPANASITSSYGNFVVGGTCTLPDDHIDTIWITNQLQVPTLASSPAYKEGRVYYNTSLGKLRVAGATTWETVTST